MSADSLDQDVSADALDQETNLRDDGDEEYFCFVLIYLFISSIDLLYMIFLNVYMHVT